MWLKSLYGRTSNDSTEKMFPVVCNKILLIIWLVNAAYDLAFVHKFLIVLIKIMFLIILFN